RVFEVATGQVTTLRGCKDEFSKTAFSPDSRYLAVGGDERLCLWDLADGKASEIAFPSGGRAVALAFDESGHRLFSAHTDGTIFETAVQGPSTLRKVRDNLGSIISLCLSPKG